MSAVTTTQDAETITSSSENESSKTFTFRFNDLPPEVRDIIWEATLPPSRVFQVSGSVDNPETRYRPHFVPSTQTLKFFVHHAPPVTTCVCRESRAVALRRGCFLSPRKAYPGMWFNPELDILYFDRNMRYLFKTREGKPIAAVEGLDHVLHIGMGWRAWFRDIPRLRPGEDMRHHWRAAIEPLFLYAPRLRTINFVLPKVRKVGGVSFGREAFGAANYPCELVPLPEMTKLPWEKVRVRPRTTPGPVGPTTASLVGSRSYFTMWSAIQQEMERSLEFDAGEDMDPKEDEWRHIMTKRGESVPRVVGWWLLRPEAPKNYEQQQVKEFSS